MKNKHVLSTVLACAMLVMAGCKSNNVPLPMQKALYVTAVSSGVAIGVDKYPEVVPYLRVANPIICAAGNGTNVTPVEIISALTNSPAANAVATKEGKLILNGALNLYVSMFESYGTDWITKQEQLKEVLGWTCDAINQGLPAPTNALMRAAKVKQLPPHIK